MAGLSSFISDTTQQSTTLPSWYDAAQQKAVSGATAGTAAMPALQNTLAGQAINTLQSPTNPFQQAGATAQQIASGAANPWNVSSTGQVTPNTNTALGGLFQAQNQQLQQLMPNIKAAPEAGNIASGGFGSLRGQTAVNKALGDAQANLFAQQMQNALQNQQTGVSASTAAGNLANQNITNQTALGQLQQMDPTMQSATLAKILGAIKAPETVTQSAQLSPLSQIGSVSQMLGSQGAVNSLLQSLGVKGGISGLGKTILGGLSSLTGGGVSDATQAARDASGTGSITNGTLPDIGDGAMPTDSSGNIDTSGAGWGTGGGTDWANIPSSGPVDNGFDFSTE